METSRTDKPTRMGWPLRGLLVIAATLAFFAGLDRASATVVEFTSLEELVELSDVAVRGEVVDRRVSYDERQDRILTHTTIDIETSYMGDVGERVRIEQWGGTYQGETMRVPGDARFETGEEVVVFLRRDDDSEGEELFLTALAQSKYSVQRRGEAPVVSRDLSELTFADADSERLYRVEGRIETLASFEARLRSLVYAARGGAP